MCQNKNYIGILNHDECFQIINNDTRFRINYLGSPILCNEFRICTNSLKYKVYIIYSQIITDGQYIYINDAKYFSVEQFINQIRNLQYFKHSISNIQLQIEVLSKQFYFELLNWNTILQYNGSLDINISLNQVIEYVNIIEELEYLLPITVIIGKYRYVNLYNFTTFQHINIYCTQIARLINITIISNIIFAAPAVIVQNLTYYNHDIGGFSCLKFNGNNDNQFISMLDIKILQSYLEDLAFFFIKNGIKNITVVVDDLSIIDSIFWKRSILFDISISPQYSTLEMSSVLFKNLSLYNSVNFFGQFKVIKIKHLSLIDCYFSNSMFFQPSHFLDIESLFIKNLTTINSTIINSKSSPIVILINNLQLIDSSLKNSQLMQYSCENTSIFNLYISNLTLKKSQFIIIKANITVINSLTVDNAYGIRNLINIESNIINITNIKVYQELSGCEQSLTSTIPLLQIQHQGELNVNNISFINLCLYSSLITISNSNQQDSLVSLTDMELQTTYVLMSESLIQCNSKNSQLLLKNILIQANQFESANRFGKYYLIDIISKLLNIENMAFINNQLDSARQNSYYCIITESVSINGNQIINQNYQQEIIAHIQSEEFYLTHTKIMFYNDKPIILSNKNEYLIVMAVPKLKNAILHFKQCVFDFDYQANLHSGFMNLQQQNGTVQISDNTFKGFRFQFHGFTFGTFMGHVEIINNVFLNHNSGLFDIEFTDQLSDFKIKNLYVSRENKCNQGNDRNLISCQNGQVNFSEISILNLCFAGILLEYNNAINMQNIIIKQCLDMNNILNINAIQSKHIEINNLTLKSNIELKHGLFQITNLLNYNMYKINNITLINNICQDYCLQIKASQSNEINQRILQEGQSLTMNSIVILQNIGVTLVSIYYLELKMIDAFLYSVEQQLNQTTLTYSSKSEQLSFYNSNIYINENGLQLNQSRLLLSNTTIFNTKMKFYFAKHRQIMVSLDDGYSMLMNEKIFNITDQTHYDQAKLLKQNIIYDKFYIPTGQQFNQYQRLNLANLKYEDYKIHFKFKITNQFGFVNVKNSINCQLQMYDSNGYLDQLNLTTQNISQISYPPLSEIQFRVYCYQKDEDPLLVVFNTKVFPCQIGEILNNKQCLRCQSSMNLYSVQLNAQQSGLINLRKTFWRASLTNGNIEECNQIQRSCNGGWNAGDKSCEIGYLGALCSECDLYNIYGNGKYQKGQDTSCRECDFNYSVIWQIFLILAIQLFMIFSEVNDFINTYIILKITKLTHKNHSILIKLQIDQSSILLKLLVFYVQLTMLSNNLPTTNLLSLKSFTNLITNSSLSASSRLQCIFSDFLSQTQLQYMNSLFTVIFSSMALNAFIFCIGILFWRKIIVYKSCWISTALFYLLMMNYANYFDQQLLYLFSLIQLVTWREISGIKWVTYNLSLKYDQKGHYLSMISIVLPQILNVMFLPILLFVILKKYSNTLQDERTYKTLGYFYKDYSNNRYYWGIVQKVLRSFSIIVTYFFYDQEITKILAQVSYLLIFQRFQQFQQPYNIHRLNNVDSLLIYFQCLSIVILGFTQNVSENKQVIRTLLIIMFYLVNLIVLIKLVQQIFTVKRKQLSQHIGQISNLISKLSPKLQQSLKLSQYKQKKLRVEQNIELMRRVVYSKQFQRVISGWYKNPKEINTFSNAVSNYNVLSQQMHRHNVQM